MTIAPLEDDPSERPGPGSAATIEARIADFADGEYRRVVATIALWSGSVDDAADAVADALGLAWEKLDRGEPVDNLAAFITTAAMNRVRSSWRHRSVARSRRHLLGGGDPSDPSATATNRVAVGRALASLTKRQREIVGLRYGADLAVADIATRLGIAEGTVKATLHQARNALADDLEDPTKGASK